MVRWMRSWLGSRTDLSVARIPRMRRFHWSVLGRGCYKFHSWMSTHERTRNRCVPLGGYDMTHRLSPGSCISLLLGMMACTAVNANETGSEPSAEATTEGTLQEVVVTAQKRSESVQEVPVSVTVLSNEELSRQGVQTISDLSRMSSSLEFTAASAA